MNVLNQYVDVYKNWADVQLKTGQNWVETMQSLEGFKPGLILDKTIDAYQASVQSTLDAEVAGTQLWFEEVVPVENMPQIAVDLTKQMQEMTNKVTETQQTVADEYFGLLRKIDFKGLPLTIAEEAQEKPAPKKAAKKA